MKRPPATGNCLSVLISTAAARTGSRASPRRAMSPTVDPIAPWPVVVIAGLVILGLTLWAYSRKLRGSQGRWRWVALALRLAAIALCSAGRAQALASGRSEGAAGRWPSCSCSTTRRAWGSRTRPITAAGSTSRRETLEAAQKDLGSLGPKVEVRTLGFNEKLQALSRPGRGATGRTGHGDRHRARRGAEADRGHEAALGGPSE